MSEQKSLLVELGTEELPVKALPGLAQAFFDGVITALEKRGIGFERGDAKPLYTPRRLAVLLPAVDVEQPEQKSEVLGPYLNIALDANGAPTKALEGFAAKAGIDWTALERTTDGKGERFVHRAVKPGAKTAVTEYRTLQSRRGLSLVECRLLTGRTHQIRAQMAAAGCPLLGDGKYGRERINRTYGETGQMLYSYKLTFTLPTDAGILEYLRGRTFQVQRVPFAEKYFPDFKLS